MLAIFNYYTELQPQPVEVGKVNIFFFAQSCEKQFQTSYFREISIWTNSSIGGCDCCDCDRLNHAFAVNECVHFDSASAVQAVAIRLSDLVPYG